ncbi:hypothetical protein HPO96_37205 [Kribbella sandramycini]|uniref:Uncharacterized protein n=1 Tax=Kribbella sandramycini TaxID=60450 RepID=A0A7Y4L7P1_9ACTN|nr:hypothetical protein [Kribbella sandramycini]MBB6564442.1 hypothetical protein [Kribbella sandramycini]NOL45899.1 hypothetical protein [Kribbella sandramycini]
MKLDKLERAAVAGIVILLLAVGIGLVFAIRAGNGWEARCKAAGGHVVTNVSVGSAVGPKGQPIVVTSADSLCLSADGRILEV